MTSRSRGVKGGRGLRRAVVSVVMVLGLAGCRQDMHDAPRYDPLEASSILPGGAASQPLVEEIAPPSAGAGDPRRKMVAASADAPTCPQLAMLRVRGSLYFGAVNHVRERFHEGQRFVFGITRRTPGELGFSSRR